MNLYYGTVCSLNQQMTLIKSKLTMTIQQIIKKQSALVNNGDTADFSWRKQQLETLKRLFAENEQSFIQAIAEDLAKSEYESWVTEISYVQGEISHSLKHLKKWMKAKSVFTPVAAQPGRSFILPEPLGSILIIGAWNYPIQLIFAPLVSALAAGNTAVLKPSELAPETSALITRLISQYFPPEIVTVVEGGVAETTELLDCQFDHIMYTGSGNVGKIVMQAAAKHLTPVTLELGGKSPVYFDESALGNVAVERLAWGKWLNAGQTCVAPDYVLTTKDAAPKLVELLEKQIKNMFGDSPENSDSYGCIINQRHLSRLVSYLENQDVVIGGQVNSDSRYMSPTAVLVSDVSSPVMQDEIFGPILPIVIVDDFEQAKAFVKERAKPLAAYIFSKNTEQTKQWQGSISAGSMGINDVFMFTTVPDLPFGGVGGSGMGCHSGKHGFDNFSHFKSVIKRPLFKDLPIRFAPFNKLKLKLVKLVR